MNSGAYKFFLLLHLLGAIIGFGAVYLNAIYGVEIRRRKGREGLAIAEANYRVSGLAQYFIYSVPITGIILIILSDDVWEFSDTWISLAFLLYIVGLGVSHGVLLRNVKRMNVLMGELATAGPPPGGATGGPPPQVAELEQRGRTVGMAGAFLNVLLIVLVALMVWKPGT